MSADIRAPQVRTGQRFYIGFGIFVIPASIWVPLLSIVGFVVLNAVVAPSAIAVKVASWRLEQAGVRRRRTPRSP